MNEPVNVYYTNEFLLSQCMEYVFIPFIYWSPNIH